MEVGNKYFVRVDYKIDCNEVGKTDFDDHIEYLQKVSTERFFLGGGFSNAPGGMILFQAKDIKEATRIASDDPLIKRNLYSYELFEWDIVLASKK